MNRRAILAGAGAAMLTAPAWGRSRGRDRSTTRRGGAIPRRRIWVAGLITLGVVVTLDDGSECVTIAHGDGQTLCEAV